MTDIKTCVCGNKFEVTDTRVTKRGIRRRRKCNQCGESLTTIEIPMTEYKDLETDSFSLACIRLNLA